MLRRLLFPAVLALLSFVLYPLTSLIPDRLPGDPTEVVMTGSDPGAPEWSLGRVDWPATYLRQRQALGPLTTGDLYAQYRMSPLAQLVTVGKSGAQFTTISGALCATATSTSAAGSALDRIKSRADYGPTKPYVVAIGPGVYNECVSIDAITDVLLLGVGNATFIHPTVVAAADVSGGVIRLANSTTTKNSTRRIELASFMCRNDATSAPEACIQSGKEVGPGAGNESPWTDVFVHDVTAIGLHDGVQWWGSSLTTATDVPRFDMRDSTVISAADACQVKDFADSYLRNVACISWSNYCESTDTTHLAVQGPSAIVSAADTTHFVMQADTAGASFYNGRTVTITSIAGACGATNTAMGVFQVTAFDSATDTITFTPAASETPTAGCNYTIAGVGVSNWQPGTSVGAGNPPPCTDVDWSILETQWRHAAFVAGQGSAPAAVPDSAMIHLVDSSFKVYDNDFSTTTVTCSATSPTTVSGIQLGQLNTTRQQSAVIDNADVQVNISQDIMSNGCNPTVIGIGLIGPALGFEGSILVNNPRIVINNADPNVNIGGIVSGATGGAATIRAVGGYIEYNDIASNNGTFSKYFQASSGVLNRCPAAGNIPESNTGTVGLISGCEAYGSATIDPNSIVAPLCQNLPTTITVTGAAVGDVATPAPDPNQMVAGVNYECWVSSANTVTCEQCCVVGTCNPPSATFGVSVRKK